MPLERIVLSLVILAGAFWTALAIASALSAGPVGMVLALPLAVGGYLLWRVIAERRANAEDDRYERIEK